MKATLFISHIIYVLSWETLFYRNALRVNIKRNCEIQLGAGILNPGHLVFEYAVLLAYGRDGINPII